MRPHKFPLKSPALFAGAFLLAACSHKDKPNFSAPYDSTSPESVIQAFYKSYLTEEFGDEEPGKRDERVDSIKKAFLTKGLLKKLERYESIDMDSDFSDSNKKFLDSSFQSTDFDANYFTKSQDTSGEWVANISAGEFVSSGDLTTTTVTLGKQETWKLNVTLKQAGGAWKIDNIRLPQDTLKKYFAKYEK